MTLNSVVLSKWQVLLDFKNEINSVLVNIKTEMQSKFDDFNNRLNVIENNIRSSINDQVNESMANIKDSIINALNLFIYLFIYLFIHLFSI